VTYSAAAGKASRSASALPAPGDSVSVTGTLHASSSATARGGAADSALNGAAATVAANTARRDSCGAASQAAGERAQAAAQQRAGARTLGAQCRAAHGAAHIAAWHGVCGSDASICARQAFWTVEGAGATGWGPAR
jgi:hypothetical protein